MNYLFAEIITIGDEILFGQITDTNTQYISTALTDMGIKVRRKTSVGDVEKEILDALHEAHTRADIIIVTGGLGPTKDDITKPTFCKFFNTRLVQNLEVLAHLELFFKERGYELTDRNKGQAMVPENCEALTNTRGTAPGMWFEHNGKITVSLPGVPYEMKTLMELSVVPRLKTKFKLPAIVHKMILTTGIGESWLADIITDWEEALPADIKLAYLPGKGSVRLRLTATGDNGELLKARIDDEVKKLLPLIDKYVYGFDNDTLESIVGGLLMDKKLTLATGESCTGGLLASLITSVPGSAGYFTGSIVAYQNHVKNDELNVSKAILEKDGAVSEATVTEMVKGLKKKFNTEVNIAVSGIAGPGGATPGKPVGTVWTAIGINDSIETKLYHFKGDRAQNMRQTCTAVLEHLRTLLK